MLRRVCGSVRTGLLVVCASALVATVACERQPSEPLAGASSPIIGGKLDTTHKGVVALLKKIPTGQGNGFFPSCTGTLLTQNLVLTARHCVAELTTPDGTVDCSPQSTTKFKSTQDPSTFRISIEANVGQEGLTPYKVSTIWVPPDSANVCGTDIALMMLEGAGIPATAAATIEPRIASPVPADDVFSAIGYGLQDPNDELAQTAGHRMAVQDATVYCQGGDCQTNLVEDDEFVAESPVCSGDSGGPALDSDGRVCGVTSRGDAQCTIAIYSSVAAWRDFIVEKALEAAQGGGYAPPTWAGGSSPGTGGGGSGGASHAGSGGDMPNGGTSSPVAGRPGTGGRSGGESGNGGSNTSGSANDGGSASTRGGNQSVGNGGSSSTPTFDPLGQECSQQKPCLGSYKCWSASGTPPGICVPACSVTKNSCPAEYMCDTTLNACIKPAGNQAEAQDDGGCSVGGTQAPSRGQGVWLGVSLILLSIGRRRGGKS